MKRKQINKLEKKPVTLEPLRLVAGWLPQGRIRTLLVHHALPPQR